MLPTYEQALLANNYVSHFHLNMELHSALFSQELFLSYSFMSFAVGVFLHGLRTSPNPQSLIHTFNAIFQRDTSWANVSS